MENGCILSRESDIKEQAQLKERALHETHQHVTPKEPQSVAQKIHTIRSFIIPKPSKLTITS